MSYKNRLRELVRQAKYYAQEKADEHGGLVCIDDEADYLLANGVIAPPCKVGDTVYKINTIPNSKIKPFITKEMVEPFAVVYRNIMGGYSCIPFEEFGETAFLDEEEAKAKLKECER